jgi:hypothetical protein
MGFVELRDCVAPSRPPGPPPGPHGSPGQAGDGPGAAGSEPGVQPLLRLRGPLDPDRLRGAAIACFEDFPVLKARVLQRRGRYLFDVSHRPSAPDAEEAFSFHDWSSGAADGHELLRGLVNEPLDIVAGPQLKVLLARVSERDRGSV